MTRITAGAGMNFEAVAKEKPMHTYGERGEPEGTSVSTDSDGTDNDIELTRPEVPGYGTLPETEEEEESSKSGFWRRLLRLRKRRVREMNGRETWGSTVEFVLTLIGYAVGLGNIWRFPYLCAKNGGGAFLIPYLIMLFLVGIPLFYLELLLGQSTRKGPIGAWLKIAPNLAGLGIAAVFVIVYVSLYYNVLIGWILFYFGNSFHDPLPWAYCYGYDTTHTWNTTLTKALEDNFSRIDNLRKCYNESTKFYWYNTALGVSDSIGSTGDFNWPMFLALLAAWIAVYLCLFRGIQWIGKVVYFTVTFPYVMLFCLFIRAVTLDGAGDGLKYLFLPGEDVVAEKIIDPQVWLEAATQIFFSLSVATGALTALSSYTKPQYNALKDTLIVCIINSLTSIFVGIVVFSIVGFMAKETGTDVELVSQGPGLTFIVVTEALVLMPLSPFWAVLFFIMLFLLGLDSQFAGVEGLITIIRDFKYFGKMRNELVLGVICFLMFAVSLPFTFGNGAYLLQLFDQFAVTLPLLLFGLIEFFSIGWVVGVDKFFDEICKVKHHRHMRYLWTVLWMFVNPIVMIIILLGAITRELVDPLEYTAWKDNTEVQVEYPSWAQFVGAVIVLSSILPIPVFLIARLIFLESAREEAREFLRAKVNQFENAYYRTKDFFKNMTLRWRGSWSPHTNETERDRPGVDNERANSPFLEEGDDST